MNSARFSGPDVVRSRLRAAVAAIERELSLLPQPSSTDDARKRALESWNDLRGLLRSRQDDPYYGLAEKNIRLLSDRPGGAAGE